MSTDTAARSWPEAVLEVAYYAAAAIFFGLLFAYFMTGLGGPSQLAAMMVPLTFVLFTLGALRENDLYPSLGLPLNYLIGAIYCVLAIATAIYMTMEFDAIGFARAGFWNTPDMVFGALMVLLILEYSRKRFFPLFVINIVLIVYCVYGWAVPGLFHHPGFDWEHVLTATSLEMATGVYSRLPQLALTLIGSFILVLSVLRAFGCIDSILKGAGQVGRRSPHAVPLSAVLGSIGIGAISGSGAANAITTGSATIPAMIASGLPRHHSASIEASASLGGQLMPPVMGISAFLMADFMGVSYFDVVARGYAPAIIYFVGVLTGTYLLSVHHSTKAQTFADERMTWADWANLSAFVVVVGGLIFLMAALYMAPMFAALYIFFVVGALLFIKHLIALAASETGLTFKSITAPLFRFLDSFSSVTADLTLLLATLSIMTGAFVITGVPTKIGFILIEAAGINLFVMAIVAFIFGAFLGTGLPPAPTYILTALVIAPAMIKAGVDPWCVHFFAFFLAVWGEITPPTSLVAAVTAKIAETSFMKTLMAAITLCSSLFVLMTAAFTRPELVLEPGAAQLVALGLVCVATVALMFSLQATFSERTVVDYAIRIGLAALALAILFLPSEGMAALVCIPALAVIGYWIARRRQATPEPSPATTI
jgi:TRAP transporter 4TM/12TM fusion protein